MKFVIAFVLFGFTLSTTGKERDADDPWSDYSYAVELDTAGKYWMFWTPDDHTETITFELHVEALGYVGFGISPNGGMKGSDVVIGWVLDDGTPFFHDRHALGEYEPIIDNSQDVTLLAASQNDTHTILRFSRPYITCDEDDRDITTDTIRVIYSFTDTDPDNMTELQYHGATRGTKSLVLLSYNDVDQSLPDDSTSVDFLVSETEIGTNRTMYWCEIIKVQPKEEKHHVVMFEPVITPGNEGFVHHIVVFSCLGEMQEEDEGKAWDCTENIMPEHTQCTTAMFLWAVGGNEFYFPEHTGIPFFGDEHTSPSYMRIEMHYDNPSGIQGVMDHSGIRIHMTPTLRQHDVGILVHGSSTGPFTLIPPHFTDLTYRSYCTPECLHYGINGTEVMNVFAGYQHAHLLGSKMRTRIYREGSEIEPLMIDDNYDFNFQEIRKMKQERVVYPDDKLVVDCIYDSSHKTDITVGGIATVDEMCVSFLFYYPKNNLYACNSNPPEYQSIQVIEGLQFEETEEYPHFRVTGPPEYENMTTLDVFKTMDWTNETIRNKYQDLLLEANAPMSRACLLISDENTELSKRSITPELGDSWVNRDDGPCNSSFRKTSSSFVVLLTALLTCYSCF